MKNFTNKLLLELKAQKIRRINQLLQLRSAFVNKDKI